MSSDAHSVLVGEVWRRAGLVAKVDGSAITTGTVNYYLKCLTGTNAGLWWKNSDQTWAASETANAMTHQADGSWTITLAATPFVDAILYLEYAKESGDLHVAAEGRLLRGKAIKTAATVAAGDFHDWQQAAREAHGVAGTVWHVEYAASENMSGPGYDGLSWTTAFETAGAGVRTVLDASLAGDKIALGSGTFTWTVSGGMQSMIAGTILEGAGIDVTVLVPVYSQTSEGDLGLGLASNVVVRNLTIRAGNAITMPVGTNGSSIGAVVLDAVLDHVHIVGSMDGILLYNGKAIVRVFDSLIESKWDAANSQLNESELYLYDTHIKVIGPPDSPFETQRSCGVIAEGDSAFSFSYLFMYGGSITVRSPIAGSAAVQMGSWAEIHLYGVTIDVAGATVKAVDVFGNGSVYLHGCIYDRTKISEGSAGGHIYDIADDPGVSTLLTRVPQTLVFTNVSGSYYLRVDTTKWGTAALPTIPPQLTDYQQRAVAVTLPTTAPAGYGGSLTDEQIEALAAELDDVLAVSHGVGSWQTATGFALASAWTPTRAAALDSILARALLITAGGITVLPGPAVGQVTVYVSNDYLAAQSRQLVWALPVALYGDLTGKVVTLSVYPVASLTARFTATATITGGNTANQAASVPLTSAQTALLTPGYDTHYSLLVADYGTPGAPAIVTMAEDRWIVYPAGAVE